MKIKVTEDQSSKEIKYPAVFTAVDGDNYDICIPAENSKLGIIVKSDNPKYPVGSTKDVLHYKTDNLFFSDNDRLSCVGSAEINVNIVTPESKFIIPPKNPPEELVKEGIQYPAIFRLNDDGRLKVCALGEQTGMIVTSNSKRAVGYMDAEWTKYTDADVWEFISNAEIEVTITKYPPTES